MVPGSFGCGSVVLAAITILAPSLAARNAIARPMPRDAPVMNSVLFVRLISFLTKRCTHRLSETHHGSGLIL